MPVLARETSLFPDDLFEQQPLDVVSQKTARRWWGVFTKSRQEKALARDLLAMGIPFYLPLIPKENYLRGRIIYSHIPLFGGYVFVYGDLDERYECLVTNRVSRILPVPDQQQLQKDLHQIHQLIKMGAPLTIESRLEPGCPVRIKKGPMRGLEGVIVARRGRRRLLVGVHFLQSGVSVEIDDFLVEPM